MPCDLNAAKTGRLWKERNTAEPLQILIFLSDPSLHKNGDPQGPKFMCDEMMQRPFISRKFYYPDV